MVEEAKEMMGDLVVSDSHTEKMMELVCGTFAGPEGPPGNDMAKTMCNNVIYAILANDDPKEYPLAKDGPMASPISTYSSNGSACTIGEPQHGSFMTVQYCDCSDPKNYNFEDEGRFMI